MKSCYGVDVCVNPNTCVRPISRETANTQPGEPAAAEPALPRHGLQLLQDGGEQASDQRPQDGSRDSSLPLLGVPDRGHASYPSLDFRNVPQNKSTFNSQHF